MKRCSYCGKRYPADATQCAVDGSRLVEEAPQDQSAVLPPAAPPEASTYLTFPDYQWSVRDAWKCLVTMVILGFAFNGVLIAMGFFIPGFSGWLRSGPGCTVWELLRYTILLLAAAYFARTETLAAFGKGFGLDRKPGGNVWLGVVCALAIGSIHLFITRHGWGRGVSNEMLIALRDLAVPEKLLVLFRLLVLAPVFEEAINRGFLYKAFRRSYPMSISMVVLVIWTAWTHWPNYHYSWVGAVALSALCVLLCYLREKSDSLWDCIITHFTFNALILFVGRFFS